MNPTFGEIPLGILAWSYFQPIEASRSSLHLLAFMPPTRLVFGMLAELDRS
jgi:hypothetical protein